MSNPTTTAVVLALVAIASPELEAATYSWDGGTSGGAVDWYGSASNWSGDVLPPSSASSDLLFNFRNGSGNLPSQMNVNGTKSVGIITFDNTAGFLPSSLEIRANGSGTTTQTLTVYKGISLSNYSGTVRFQANTNGTLSVVLGGNATFDTQGSSTLRLDPVVSGGYGVDKKGTGTLIVGSANTYTGATSVSEGVLKVTKLAVSSGSSSLGNAMSSVVLGSGDSKGTLSYGGGNATYTRGFSINPGGGQLDVLNSDATLNISSGEISGLSGTFCVALTGNAVINSRISLGTGGITKRGSGTLEITGSSNSYSGITTVDDGLLVLRDGNDRLPTNTAVTLGNGSLNGVLQLGSTSGASKQTLAGLSSLTGAGDRVIGGSATATSSLTLSIAASQQSFGGTLGGSTGIERNLAIIKAGSGTLELASTHTYTGGTTVTGGTLKLGIADALASTGAVTVNGGTFDIQNFDQSLGTVSLQSGTIAGTGTITSNNAYDFQSGTVNANLLGTVGLNKTTSGTVTLTGSSQISGSGTAVSGGKLVVDGTLQSNTTVVDATLGGSGTINGSVFINGGSTIAPGNSTGTLNISTLTVDGNVTYTFEINNATGTAGTLSGWDLVTGNTLNINANTSSPITINVTSLMLDQTPGLADNFVSTNSYQWVIAEYNTISYAGGEGSFDPEVFVISAANFQNAPVDSAFFVTADSNRLYLNYTPAPVPEPATVLAIGVAGLVVVGAVRRRLRKSAGEAPTVAA